MPTIHKLISSIWHSISILHLILLPLSLIYYVLAYIHYLLSKPKKVSVPVIAIGSHYVGGAGKTPLAIAIAKALQKEYNVAFLTRGYGNKTNNMREQIIKISPNQNTHSHRIVGDEPLLLSKIAPTYIHKNRYLAAKQAIDEKANLLILDDGLHQYHLASAVKINIIESRCQGNGYYLPAGPIRPLFYQTDIYITSQDYQIKIVNPLPKNSKVIAFCGIAIPQKFLDTLHSMEVNVQDFINFPDHYNYQENTLQELLRAAYNTNAILVTTAKDYVKLPQALQQKIYCLEIIHTLSAEKINEIRDKLMLV